MDGKDHRFGQRSPRFLKRLVSASKWLDDIKEVVSAASTVISLVAAYYTRLGTWWLIFAASLIAVLALGIAHIAGHFRKKNSAAVQTKAPEPLEFPVVVEEPISSKLPVFLQELSRPAYWDYREDVFSGVKWKWEWSEDATGVPRDRYLITLQSHCPCCDRVVTPGSEQRSEERNEPWLTLPGSPPRSRSFQFTSFLTVFKCKPCDFYKEIRQSEDKAREEVRSEIIYRASEPDRRHKSPHRASGNPQEN